ncbi:MAG: signal peptidase II [Nitrospirota bacterium]|nr:signal peptidase II [Thermodesulfovibrionales bacterium]
MRRFKYVFLISLIIIVLDQITKHLVLKYMNPFESIEIFPFLHIVSVRNTGGAFGMFKSVGSTLFIAVSVMAIIFVIWLLIRTKEGYFGLSLILGGAIGNITDRLRYGWVVDFIDFSIGKFHWPAFNVADSALTIGVIVVLLSSQLHG